MQKLSKTTGQFVSRKQSKLTGRHQRIAFSACALITAMAANHAIAASGTWNGAGTPPGPAETPALNPGTYATDTAWTNAANWVGGIIPGVNDGTFVNTDTATFDNTQVTGNNPVTTDTNRNLQNITFAASSLQFSVGSATTTLYLTGGGMVQEQSNVATGASDNIVSPIVIKGSTYTFDNESSTTTSGLKLNGGFSGGVPGPLTVTLTGVNANTPNQTSNSQISGNITDGSATHLSLVKNGTGVWSLQGTANTFSGDITINAGAIRFTTLGSLPSTANVTVNNTGTLRLSVIGGSGSVPTIPTLTINGGGAVGGSSGAGINIKNDSGPAMLLQFQPTGSTAAISTAFFLTGAGPAGSGGVTLTAGASGNTQLATISGTSFDLGSVDRTFSVEHAGTNSTDLQINSIVQGAAGIIKTGLGTLKFNNSANTFAGPIEIQQGSLKLNGTVATNSLSGSNNLIIDGGDLNLNPDGVAVGNGNTTVPSTSFTSGSLSGVSPPTSAFPNTTASLMAPSFNFNVQSTNSFTVNATLADGTGGPSPLVSSGAGLVTLNKANTYTGSTTVNAGTLNIATTGSVASTSFSVAGGAALSINGSVPASSVINTSGTVTFGANASTGIAARVVNTLNIAGTGVVSVSSPSAHANRTVLVANTLGFAGAFGAWQGKLDLKDNDMIVHGGSLANISNQLKQGFNLANNGFWNGSAGIVSSAAQNDPTHLTTLGVIQNNDGSNHTIYGSGTAAGLFDGQDPALTDVLVKYTYFGDADLSGHVDGTDYSKIDNGFNNHLTGWFNGDFNYDGVIDGSDYSLIDNAFNTQGASLGGGTATAMSSAGVASEIASTSVPEPVGFGMILVASVSLLNNRRRRR